jgi:DNA-binding transcriptional LysR family regulator
MIPTNRAQALAGPVAEALALMRSALARPASFDARSLRRTFVLVTSDYGELVLLPELMRRLTLAAPEVSLVVRGAIERPDRLLGSGEHDLYLAPSSTEVEGVRSERLFRDEFVSVMRAAHPLANKRLTLDRFVACAHVLVSPQGAGEAPVDAALRQVGRQRKIALRIPHFLIAPRVLAETDHIITLPERMVRAAFPPRRFVVHRPPLPVPGFVMQQFWHERNDTDPGHRWLRGLLAEVAHRR